MKKLQKIKEDDDDIYDFLMNISMLIFIVVVELFFIWSISYVIK